MVFFQKTFITIVLLGSISLCSSSETPLQSDCNPVESDPVIEFTFVPAYGSTYDLEGRVRNVNPDSFKVAIYIFIEGAGWWTKPNFGDPLTPIQSDSTWVADITTGGSDIYATRIQAYLLPKDSDPPLAGGLACLPDTLNLIAVADTNSTRNPRSISFSGYNWDVKTCVVPVGPGPNLFSDTTENVWVDSDDNLHLKITERNGSWYCSEVILRDSLGYGHYIFQITGQIGIIDENIVLGFFSWDNDACVENHREIDIEFSRWGNNQDTTNAQYVVQPWNIAGNLKRWHMPTNIDSSTHGFSWNTDSIRFFSVKDHQSTQPYDSILYLWTYTGSNIPIPGSETIRINLWLYNGTPPSNGQEVEVIISRFEYIPLYPVFIGEQGYQTENHFCLFQNFPNPFNSSTQIRYSVSQESKVIIKVYDLIGREVSVLLNKRQFPGEYSVQWIGDNLPSGTYFYQLISEQFMETKKMLLIR